MKERLLISACLIGANCKYSGGNNALPPATLAALRGKYRLLPVCPELAGGLRVPRTPCERRGGKVFNRDGENVTAAFRRGAELACTLCERFSCRRALLKERSPSCGAGTIYDGSFSHSVIEGDGVTAEALRALGLELFGENGLGRLI